MEEIALEIDGREVKAREGTTLLEAAKSAGIDIPTLCYHPALSPFGACRLCSVELISRGRGRIVTSCNYPVEEGLAVSTKSPDVLETRKMLIELMLARCPNVKIVQDLARGYGVEKPRFKLEDEECILCGLCARICEERMGVSAINFMGRGVDRKVETPFQESLDINLDICIACGACAHVCPTGAIKLEDITVKKPVPILSEFEAGLDLRPPIYIPLPQAVPNVPVVDREKCVHFLTDKCRICQDLCEPKAIDFEQEEEIIEIEVGSIILATGYDQFDPSDMPEYGYKRYDNVLTGLEFERMTCAGGPTKGRIQLKDGTEPESVAIIHCVGSRDQNYHEYCSRVCCMYGLKYAHLIKELTNNHTEVFQFYIDMRCFGEGYEEFYQRCSEEGVNFIRGKVGSITAESPKGKLIVNSVDTLAGKVLRIPVDMVILCAAVEARSDAADVASLFTISRRADGFFLETHPKLAPVDTPTDGVYLAGCCQGPRDIPDTVAQASAAASKCLSLISKGKVRVEPAIANVDENLCQGCGQCEEICDFHAPKVISKNGVMVSTVNETLCKGCGACAVACPSGAMSIKHFTRQQILNMVDALTGV